MIEATKAIVLLASDMGAIYNVTAASDVGTRISDSASKICDAMSTVAQNAETISRLSMQAPAKVSEISGLADQLALEVKAVKQFAQTLASRKALNPLIPETLMSLANKAIHDADEASALVAIALQSATAAEIQV